MCAILESSLMRKSVSFDNEKSFGSRSSYYIYIQVFEFREFPAPPSIHVCQSLLASIRIYLIFPIDHQHSKWNVRSFYSLSYPLSLSFYLISIYCLYHLKIKQNQNSPAQCWNILKLIISISNTYKDYNTSITFSRHGHRRIV